MAGHDLGQTDFANPILLFDTCINTVTISDGPTYKISSCKYITVPNMFMVH